jgi:hypothetical protein
LRLKYIYSRSWGRHSCLPHSTARRAGEENYFILLLPQASPAVDRQECLSHDSNNIHFAAGCIFLFSEHATASTVVTQVAESSDNFS